MSTPARNLGGMTELSTTHLGELRLDELTLTVPLTADAADERTIDIFARIATRPGGEKLPYLVFLQGGPCNEAPRPSLEPLNPSWLEAALDHYRVVMLDQRGTGLSTPVSDLILEEHNTTEHEEY